MLKHFFPGIAMLFCVILSSYTFGAIIYVPNDANTIQTGINIAQKGDTILVEEGTYFENIKFRGKSVVVASHFIIDRNPDHILKTIINGSTSTDHDSASCVLFHGEDSDAVLQGFTLTEGRGTRYTLSNLSTTTKYNGKITVEGGGIFFNESNATVKNNLIVNNQAAAVSGYDYNGGGGISSFCGNPKIVNNVVMQNRSISGNGTYGYAAGIVFNESNGVVRNNIIYNNHTTGRGALFVDINIGVIVENNTIVGNVCNRDAAGIFNRSPNSVFRNNIVWGNMDIENQIMGIGSDDVFEYSFTDQKFDDQSTIFNAYPEFGDSNFILCQNSPCVDAGNPDTNFNDIEDGSTSGKAKLPALGDIRNDIGAYGGPHADIFPDFHYEAISMHTLLSFPTIMVNDSSTKEIEFSNLGTTIMKIDSFTMNNTNELSLKNNVISECKPMQNCVINVTWKPLQAGNLRDTLKIFHNLTEVANPAIVKIYGTAEGETGMDDDLNAQVPLKFELQQNFPNPFNLETKICFQIKEKSHVILKIYNITGIEILTLVNQTKPAGKYTVSWGGTNQQGQIVPSGVYVCHLRAGEFSDKKKLMVLK